MLSEQILENQDIFFVCQVDAQPPTRELTWLHNDRPINESSSSSLTSSATTKSIAATAKSEQTGSGSAGANRLIVSNNSLVLQRVQLDQAGVYACMAANGEGVGLSNQMELRVLRKYHKCNLSLFRRFELARSLDRSIVFRFPVRAHTTAFQTNNRRIVQMRPFVSLLHPRNCAMPQSTTTTREKPQEITNDKWAMSTSTSTIKMSTTTTILNDRQPNDCTWVEFVWRSMSCAH